MPPFLARRADFLPDAATPDRHEPLVGSNNWAVSGARSVTGDAMLANDMHLGLGAPATWFRAQFEIGAGPAAIRAQGVTLPGVPALVVGSNGKVAWGFTNSYGQWFEWIEVPHATEAGELTRIDERIAVKGGADVTLVVRRFQGHPILETQGDRSYALNWVADQGAAYNLELDDMLQADDIETAGGVASLAGIPEQNIVIADHHGRIAWTIAGALLRAPTASGASCRSPRPATRRACSLPTRRPRTGRGRSCAGLPPAAIEDPASGHRDRRTRARSRRRVGAATAARLRRRSATAESISARAPGRSATGCWPCRGSTRSRSAPSISTTRRGSSPVGCARGGGLGARPRPCRPS